MGFGCFLNCKNAQAKQSRRESLLSLCMVLPRSPSESPASSPVPSHSRNRSRSPHGKISVRREAKDDETVEVSPPFSSIRPSSSAVDLEEIFKKFDADGDGMVSLSDLGDMMRSLGQNPTDEELRVIVSEADLNRDGYIDLSEFVALNSETAGSSRRLEDLKDVFKMFDKNGDGSISPNELLHVLTSLREPCTLADCEAMIRKFDSNGDGFISFYEFVVMMNASDGPSRHRST